MLPDSILGEAFVKEYASHDDTLTIIDQKRSYEVKAPTKHPIFENFRVTVSYILLSFYYNLIEHDCIHSLHDFFVS